MVGCPEAEIRERISAYELAQWDVLEKIDPWGPKRADHQAAVIAYVMACCFSGKRKPSFRKILKLFDFETAEEQTDEEIAQIFSTIVKGK